MSERGFIRIDSQGHDADWIEVMYDRGWRQREEAKQAGVPFETMYFDESESYVDDKEPPWIMNEVDERTGEIIN